MSSQPHSDLLNELIKRITLNLVFTGGTTYSPYLVTTPQSASPIRTDPPVVPSCVGPLQDALLAGESWGEVDIDQPQASDVVTDVVLLLSLLASLQNKSELQLVSQDMGYQPTTQTCRSIPAWGPARCRC